MAKRREGQVIELQPAPVAAVEDESAEDSSLTRFLIERATGANDATVKIYRAAGAPGPGGAKLARDAFLFQTGPDEFSEEFLQDEYGAGTFRLRLYGSLPQRDYGLIVNRLIEIGAPPRSRAPTLAAAPAPGPAVQASGEASEIARAMASAMGPVFTALTTILQQVMGSGNTRQQSLTELKELAQIVGLSRGNQPDQMAQLTSMVGLAKELAGSGDGDKEPSNTAVLMKALDALGPMLQGKLPGGAVANQPAALPAPAGNAATVTESNVGSIALKTQLIVLLNAAKANSAPETYATLIYENAPDEVLDVLESPDWYAELCKLEPGFAGFRPWAESVRGMVLQAIQEQEPEPAPGATANLTPGQDGATVTHAKAPGNVGG